MAPVPTDQIQTGDEDTPQRSPEELAAIEASQGSDGLTKEQVQSATDWFLSDEEEPPATLTFDVDVSAAGHTARYIRWTVRALSRQEIKMIRENATRDGVEDDMEVNMRVLIAGSLNPDFTQEAVRHNMADPADIVNKRFRHKPGAIDRIAGKVNEVSGYGVAGLNLIRPVDAAGN